MVKEPEKVPLTVKFSAVRVPGAVPDALSSLELTAVCTAVNSVVNSVPFKTLLAEPDGSESLLA